MLQWLSMIEERIWWGDELNLSWSEDSLLWLRSLDFIHQDFICLSTCNNLSQPISLTPTPPLTCMLHAKLLQSCLILCSPMDCSPPGSSVHGILKARILEWVAMPSSRGSSQPRDPTHVSYVSCIGRQVLYHQRHPGSPPPLTGDRKKDKVEGRRGPFL